MTEDEEADYAYEANLEDWFEDDPDIEDDEDDYSDPWFIDTSEWICVKCGCTNEDCKDCIEKTGEPCYWVEENLCSACAPPKINVLQTKLFE